MHAEHHVKMKAESCKPRDAKACQQTTRSLGPWGQGWNTFSQHSQDTTSADTSISDFQPPELGDNACLLFQSPRLCYFGTTAPAGDYRGVGSFPHISTGRRMVSPLTAHSFMSVHLHLSYFLLSAWYPIASCPITF